MKESMKRVQSLVHGDEERRRERRRNARSEGKREWDKQEISRILDRFMAGETSLDEEQMLAEYFRTHQVDDEWREYKEMFALFDSGKVDVESKPRIVRLWPWVAAACVAALLVVFLSPPNKETITKPQIAKVEPKIKTVEERTQETPSAIPPKTPSPLPKETPSPLPLKGESGHSQQTKHAKKQGSELSTPLPAGRGTGVGLLEVETPQEPFEDPRVQFAEQARALRERGNRVIQRVSMNSMLPDNYQNAI